VEILIKRLLIANRGEIALRVIRACRELGIESVAVFSDADAGAPHISAADRAVRLGPAPAAESYLAIGKIIDAARRTECDAVHPGYGFLSENPAFAAACEEAGIVFVGPPSPVIASMGSKIAARRLMAAAGVPVVPGETPQDQSDEGVLAAIDRVGLPVLIKASAGGGGKGMREVHDRTQAAGLLQAARREAASAFGDGTLYVERLLQHPHHIEVQIFADDHGHVVHLFERECSVQRRHQKVIEETPSPLVAMTPALRTEITGAAIKAAAAASYRNAGTVEFLAEPAGGGRTSFYFLEMNTRLQVEHAITEEVLGVDLVRAQLLVASGAPLPWTQDSLRQRGHAIEARIYAEDPSKGFLPQAGSILLYREPALPGLRIDSGVAEGVAVPVQYDSLIAKVIARAETREAATSRLIAGLRGFPILGIRTNLPFLIAILEHPQFRDGSIDTGFLDAEGGALAAVADPRTPPPAAVRAAVAAYADAPARASHGVDPWVRLQGWRN
jgi:acetyl/propionyl-CoA carboxylase alpha subunit